MTEPPVLDTPQEREIRDELQRLVLADLHGPLGGDDEEFSGENPIDRYPLGRLAPRGVVLDQTPTTISPPPMRAMPARSTRSPAHRTYPA